MKYPFEINIQRFKSIRGTCTIPLNSNTTIIIGQNNSGKSNILRACAAIFNKKLNAYEENLNFSFKIKGDINVPRLPNSLNRALMREQVELHLDESRKLKSISRLDELSSFASSHDFLNTFGSSSSLENNIQQIYGMILKRIEEYLQGTVYVPTTRYIKKRAMNPKYLLRKLCQARL